MNVVFDLDGVFTNGSFLYTVDGKIAKCFGAHDHDCISILKKHINIAVVTADSKGFEISERRVFKDMGVPIFLVSSQNRRSWIDEKFGLETTIYMGDGLFDAAVFSHCLYSICPANGLQIAKDQASYVTTRTGGDGAVAEACMHIAERFLGKSIIDL